MFRFPIYFNADDGAAGGGEGTPAGSNEGDTATPPEPKPEEKVFTQADLNKAAEKARKEGRSRAMDEAKEAARLASMSESERLAAEKAEAVKLAADATENANQRIIRAEAKVIAGAAGVKAEQLSYVLKLADLSAVTIGEDGEPDAKEITTAITAVLKDFPLLSNGKLPQADAGAGGGHSGGAFDMNAMIRGR